MKTFTYALMIFISSLTLTNTLSATNHSQSADCNYCGCEPRDCCCECIPRPSLQSPCDPAYNAPFRIGTCWDISISGSYIYWEAIQDGLSPGAIATDSGGNNIECLNYDFDYKSGFKVGLGFNFDWDNWDVSSEYTWYHTRNDETNNENQNLIPFFVQTITNVDQLDSSWSIDFDQVDAQLGRSYFAGRLLILRPHLGVRAFWMSQTFNQTAVLKDVEQKGSATFSNWAVGPRVGLDTRWCFCEGFYLFGNAGASLLYTEFDNISASSIIDENTTDKKFQDEKRTFTDEFDIIIGLGWENYIDACNKWHLSINAGYEITCIKNQNYLTPFASTISGAAIINPYCSNNLYFHGLTATARLDF